MSSAYSRRSIDAALEAEGIVILPPNDAVKTLEKFASLGIEVQTTILDPWYNKGIGGPERTTMASS